jgi:midasin (ATPase involved in ribosome maturation)
MLSVRDYQQKSNEEAKQFSGLGGIIFEGTSGNGKSEFVINVLKTQGYQKAELNAPSTSGKYYYKLPVGMSSVKKDALLLKAFHEGAVVIIDEINSCHLNEVLLNCLLMGRDLNGKRARVPGFKLIGTQNSIDNLGRKAKSQAIERRFLTCLFDDYPLHVLIRILKEKSLDDALAKKLSLEFIQARDHAIAFNLKPLPNIRILMKVVNRTLKEKDQEFNRSFLSFRDHKVLPQARGRQSMQPPIKKTKTARSSSHNP